MDLFILCSSYHIDQLHQAEASLTPTANLIRKAHSWIDFPGQQHKRVHMSLTSCHKACATIRGLLGGTAVHHSVINTYTMAMSATFHSQVSTDSVTGQLVYHIYFNSLMKGQAGQMPTLVFVPPSLWFCLESCPQLPVESLYTSCWGTVLSSPP